MVLYWFMVALGFVLLLWFIHEKCKAYTVKATVIKSVVSALFMGVATYSAFKVALAGAVGLTMPYFILVGCLFGLLGDIWLDLKYVHRSDETLYTFAGFCVFEVMHLIIIAGVITTFSGETGLLVILLPIVIGMVVGIVNVMLDKVLKLDYGNYKSISGIYGGVLIGTTLMFGALAIQSGFHNSFFVTMFIGYVLFLISDLVLSQTYFAGKEGKAFIAVNYAAYYAAMYVIASASLMLI